LTSQGSSAGGRAAIAALVAAASICLLALVPSWAQAATGSIAGTVTDASTAEPIEGIEVCAEPLDEEGSFACALTETDGTYLIGGLQPDQYAVWFWGHGEYEFQYYDGAASWFEADPVEVVSGAKTAGIDAALDPTAAIEGTVLATEDGLGVEEVEVCAYPVGESGGWWECSETAADGTYAIHGLAPGDYKVEFWPGWTGRQLAYQFYDHRVRYSEADVVTLGADEQRTGVDADLPPGAAIVGHVSRLSTGLPLEEVRVCAIDATIDTLTVCTWTNEKGDYRLRLLPAGSYKVVFSPELWEFFPGEAFPGEEDDGLPTQFWNTQTTLAAANVLTLGVGASVGGIDARLGGAPAVIPPATVVPQTTTPLPKRKRKCRRGYKRKLVHGKRRCVKVRKRHRRHHHSLATRAEWLGPGAVRVLAR
jgi:hypothetical protein